MGALIFGGLFFVVGALVGADVLANRGKCVSTGVALAMLVLVLVPGAKIAAAGLWGPLIFVGWSSLVGVALGALVGVVGVWHERRCDEGVNGD